MRVNSISGLICYAKDLDKTIAFYSDLGFRAGERHENSIKFYVNWFSIDFVSAGSEGNEEFKKEANAELKGAGLYIMVKVDNVDEYYKEVVAKKYKPSSEPRDWPWGNREFVLRDPDGYKLVFFQKLK